MNKPYTPFKSLIHLCKLGMNQPYSIHNVQWIILIHYETMNTLFKYFKWITVIHILNYEWISLYNWESLIHTLKLWLSLLKVQPRKPNIHLLKWWMNKPYSQCTMNKSYSYIETVNQLH